MFSFIIKPKMAYASTSAIPLAVKYGMPVAEKLIAFLLTCLATGITYKTIDDAEKAFYDWLNSLPEYEPPPDDGGGGNGWRDSIKQFLKIGTVSVAIYNLFDRIKEYYTGLGAEEGENIIETIQFAKSFISDNGKKYYKVTDGSVVYPSFVNKKYEIRGGYYIYRYIRFYFYKEGNDVYVEYLRVYDKYNNYDSYIGTYQDRGTGKCFYVNPKEYGFSGLGYGIDISPQSTHDDPVFRFKYEEDASLVPDGGGIFEVPYYVESDAAILTGENPFESPEFHQPNILDIVPTKTVVNPQGIKQTIYEGDLDDLVNDIINNITFEDIMNSNKRKPYNFIQDAESTIIQTGEETEAPYPDTGPEQETDTLTGLGKIISFLKQIINWLSNIYNNISEIPKKIGNLFFNPDNIESIDFSPITNITISNKFPFSIPWDIKRAVGMLSSEGKPPKWEIPIVTEVITIDMAEFEHLANIMRIFNTLIFIVILIILTRRVI